MHCGTGLNSTETTREHVPSKCLLQKPYPAEMITIEACRKCNEAFSLDEEYLKGLLWTVLAGSTDPEKQKTPEVACMLKRNVALRVRIEEFADRKDNALRRKRDRLRTGNEEGETRGDQERTRPRAL